MEGANTGAITGVARRRKRKSGGGEALGHEERERGMSHNKD
jgi:hypothetical protein